MFLFLLSSFCFVHPIKSSECRLSVTRSFSRTAAQACRRLFDFDSVRLSWRRDGCTGPDILCSYMAGDEGVEEEDGGFGKEWSLIVCDENCCCRSCLTNKSEKSIIKITHMKSWNSSQSHLDENELAAARSDDDDDDSSQSSKLHTADNHRLRVDLAVDSALAQVTGRRLDRWAVSHSKDHSNLGLIHDYCCLRRHRHVLVCL